MTTSTQDVEDKLEHAFNKFTLRLYDYELEKQFSTTTRVCFQLYF